MARFSIQTQRFGCGLPSCAWVPALCAGMAQSKVSVGQSGQSGFAFLYFHPCHPRDPWFASFPIAPRASPYRPGKLNSTQVLPNEPKLRGSSLFSVE
jgi:hypothetical protein